MYETFNGSERIRKNIEELEFEKGLKITVCGGICEYNDEEILEYIENADKRLYEAKKSGRNKIVK